MLFRATSALLPPRCRHAAAAASLVYTMPSANALSVCASISQSIISSLGRTGSGRSERQSGLLKMGDSLVIRGFRGELKRYLVEEWVYSILHVLVLSYTRVKSGNILLLGQPLTIQRCMALRKKDSRCPVL